MTGCARVNGAAIGPDPVHQRAVALLECRGVRITQIEASGRSGV